MRRVRPPVIQPDGPDGDPAAWRELLVDANIPDRYHRSRPELVRDPQVREWLLGTLANAPAWLGHGHGFFINGPLNTGKSSFAACLFMEALRRGERGLWLYINDVPRCCFREGDEGQRLNAKLRRCDILVLDDLGSERFALEGKAGPTLEEVARTVYDRNRTIVITSNVSWREFTEVTYLRAGPLVSVVRRLCTPVVLTVEWPFGGEPAHGQ